MASVNDISYPVIIASPEELQKIADLVTDLLQSTAKDPSQYPEAENLDGLTSLPCFNNAFTLVRASIALLKGVDGKSAFQLWQEQPGNADKTLSDFFASMKGGKGDPFTYEDFTPEQLESLILTFDKLTPEQVQAFWQAIPEEYVTLFQKPATDAASTANEAASKANEAATAAKSVLDHPGYIGTDFHVYVWDYVTGAYRQTDTVLRPEAFNIYRTYTSIANMEADAANVPEGKFVIINTGSVEEEDTGKLYVKTDIGFEYLVDISGMRGFTGKTPQFGIGTITTGDAPTVTISEDGIDDAGNPKYKLNFVLQRGPQGFTPDLSIGTVTTGLPETEASAELVDDGTTTEGAPKKKLNLTIPAGRTGSVDDVYIIQTIDHVPGENDLTYEAGGKTLPFQVGNELRYFDAEKDEYVFYKLYDIKDGKAVWKLAGSGGSDDGLVFLSAPENFETSYIEIKDGGLGGLQ